MRYIRPFDTYFLNEKEEVLYHGNKAGKTFSEFNFETFPYFYLTKSQMYANTYGRGVSQEFHVDTGNFLDLTGLGVQKKRGKDWQTYFFKKYKFSLPPEFIPHGIYAEWPFWELVRNDSRGYFKRRLKGRGYAGFIMIEESGYREDYATHEVYVALDNSCLLTSTPA